MVAKSSLFHFFAFFWALRVANSDKKRVQNHDYIPQNRFQVTTIVCDFPRRFQSPSILTLFRCRFPDYDPLISKAFFDPPNHTTAPNPDYIPQNRFQVTTTVWDFPRRFSTSADVVVWLPTSRCPRRLDLFFAQILNFRVCETCQMTL